MREVKSGSWDQGDNVAAGMVCISLHLACINMVCSTNQISLGFYNILSQKG